MERTKDLPPSILWADHLARDRRRSVHTVRAYRAAAERLTAFLIGHWGQAIDRKALARVTATDLRAYLAQRRESGLGNASAARELSAVRGFLAWANESAEQPRMRGPRVKTGVPRPISPAEAVALAEVAFEEPLVDAVCVLIHGGTFLRPHKFSRIVPSLRQATIWLLAATSLAIEVGPIWLSTVKLS